MTAYQRMIVRLFSSHLLIIAGIAFTFRLIIIALQKISSPSVLLYSLPRGFLFDFTVAIYAFVPFAVLIAILPNRWLKAARFKRILWFALFIEIYFFLFLQICEYFFYAEFTDRFNFIAVDYLVYTHEVIANIWESYSILPFVLFFVLVTALIWGNLATRRIIQEKNYTPTLRQRLQTLLGAVVLAFAMFFSISEAQILNSANPQEEVLSKNGVHSMFTAYKNNEIDFNRFYTTMSPELALKLVHQGLEETPDALESITRKIHPTATANHLNVVLVVMESMSARFLGSYGNPENLTPNLDRFALGGLFYDHLYSTGTRTVRGLEALMLSVPPTPGQSIVRRPNAKNLFNLGSVLRGEGYETRFIYGGRAVFDNMGKFFADNGFGILDQSDFPKSETPFSNAWGIADEYLFNQVIKASDASFAKQKPFLHVVLTTSNHRPYTFPDGRVKRVSGMGRTGAIEYSDYAIGKFIEDSRAKPWFDSTIFMFVADHNASVAGGSQIQPADYLIPVIFYAPKQIMPKRDSRLASQIDVTPTLLRLLNVTYDSQFFGIDLIDHEPKRAFLATYQNASYLEPDSMVVLSPNRKVEEFSFDGKVTKPIRSQSLAQADESSPLAVQKAVAYYQTASDFYKKGLMVDPKIKK
jgi:phosphoglycerol transferase MdoB-like AlkP superfamily enzyme